MERMTRRTAIASVPAIGLATIVPEIAVAIEHPDAELLALGAERDRLVVLRGPIREEARRLSEVAEDKWRSLGHSNHKDWGGYMRVCDKVGLLAAEDAREAIDNQIFPLDNKIRAIPARTAAGLKVKLDLLADYLPSDFEDEEPRKDQDWHVCLFNELADEINRLASGSA